MKISNIYITGIEIDGKWSSDFELWKKTENITFRAYGESVNDDCVHLKIKPTANEKRIIQDLLTMVEERVNREEA